MCCVMTQMYLHSYFIFDDAENISANMFMIPTNRTMAAINIGAQTQGYQSTYSLTPCSYDCGMLSCIFRIGEIKARKLSTEDVCLPMSGHWKLIFNVFQQKQLIHCQLLWQQSTCFYVRNHFHIWKTNTRQSKAKSFNMASLPPTFEAFLPHVLLAPFQICIWKAALNPYPPTLDPAKYG